MSKQETKEGPSLALGILGCVGGMFIQLVIGSLYQWGIVNIYITSYFTLSDGGLTLQSTGIVFPLMMISIGVTMRLGLYLSQITHPLVVMGVGQILQALCIFISSYMQTFWLFILFYGILFGLVAGNSFMVPIDECNKYMVGKKMIVNGVVLMGTGLGSVVFGLFSYSYLNPQHIPPKNGYYMGTPQLEEIATRVPESIRWLSLLYLVIGLLGMAMITPVCLYNRRIKNQKQQNKSQELPKNNQKIFNPIQISQIGNKHGQTVKPDINILAYVPEKNTLQKLTQSPKEAQSIKEAFRSKVFWVSLFALFFGASGCFMISGNYKTYVKQTIQDDKFLTIIGVIGAVGNGCSRFFWNLLFSKTGYKTVILSVLTIAIIVFSTIRFTTQIKQAYLFLIFLINICLGGFLVTTPTVLQYIYGPSTGANIYCFFWENYALANLLGYIFVSQLTKAIGFNNIIYVTLGMCVLAFPTIILTTFQGHWKNDTHQLEYFVHLELRKVKSLEDLDKKVQTQQNLDKMEQHHFKSNPVLQNSPQMDGPSMISLNPSQMNQIKIKPINI